MKEGIGYVSRDEAIARFGEISVEALEGEARRDARYHDAANDALAIVHRKGEFTYRDLYEAEREIRVEYDDVNAKRQVIFERVFAAARENHITINEFECLLSLDAHLDADLEAKAKALYGELCSIRVARKYGIV